MSQCYYEEGLQSQTNCQVAIQLLDDMHPLFRMQTPPAYQWLMSAQSALVEGQSEGAKAGTDSKEPLFLVQITCQVAGSITAGADNGEGFLFFV